MIGNRIFGFRGNNYNKFPWKDKTITEAYYTSLYMLPSKKKDRNLRREKCFSINIMHMCTHTQTPYQITWFKVQIGQSYTIFSGFRSKRLLSVPKLKEIVRRKEIWIKFRSHRRRNLLFWGVWQILFRESNKNLERRLKSA